MRKLGTTDDGAVIIAIRPETIRETAHQLRLFTDYLDNILPEAPKAPKPVKNPEAPKAPAKPAAKAKPQPAAKAKPQPAAKAKPKAAKPKIRNGAVVVPWKQIISEVAPDGEFRPRDLYEPTKGRAEVKHIPAAKLNEKIAQNLYASPDFDRVRPGIYRRKVDPDAALLTASLDSLTMEQLQRRVQITTERGAMDKAARLEMLNRITAGEK